MFDLDTSSPFGARVSVQLADELVVWLTTVGRSGTPHPNPVWFLWTGTEVLVFSQPNKAKLHNIAANRQVALNFNATHTGGDVGVITGPAVIDENGPTDEELAGYDRKYGEHIAGLSMTDEQFH